MPMYPYRWKQSGSLRTQPQLSYQTLDFCRTSTSTSTSIGTRTHAV
jgi:hypothetical protein